MITIKCITMDCVECEMLHGTHARWLSSSKHGLGAVSVALYMCRGVLPGGHNGLFQVRAQA